MTDNADLIAEARDFVQMGSGINVMEADRLIEELARELEVADQRAVQAEAELKDAYRTDIPSLKEQRDELAAVVEKAEDYVTRHYFDTQMGTNVLTMLVGDDPADALAEHDAALIEKLADEWHADNTGTSPRAYNWLREKARQRREEQS